MVEAEPAKPSTVPADVSMFTIKDIKSVCRARTLRLQENDVIIGVECDYFRGDVELLLDLLYECDPDQGVFLTIFRDGGMFHVISRGPLGCGLEYTKPDLAEAANTKYTSIEIAPREDYHIFEVLRDIKRKCVIIDTQPSLVATIAAPIWLIQNRLWEVLLAVVLIYGATLTVSWMLFVIAFVLLALYFRQAQITLQRSFNLMRQRQMWMIVAARNLQEVQETCRQFDPKSTFSPSYVEPPAEDNKPDKKRRRRPNVKPAASAPTGEQAE
jgi:hypothetical protein